MPAKNNNTNLNNFIKFLPTVFQSTTEKKFFDATFNQAFSKADNELLYAYLGRRNSGQFDPVNDYYVPEPTKNRTFWQLESTAYARDSNNIKDNIFFYEDLLNEINYYGGNTLNQDRLFASEYYSWCPPIDPDMFINYQNYYWVNQGLSAITITGGVGHPSITANDIIGQQSYTTPSTATPPNLTLSSGMRIQLSQDTNGYNIPHTVEFIGDGVGITLVPDYPSFIANEEYEFLPWDGTFQLSTGRIINNANWDQLPWDVEAVPTNGDYITIERGALDRNAWSRTNSWYHIDVITETIALTGSVFPSTATRALRPIIQFNANLQLYGAGTQFLNTLAYAFTNNPNNNTPIRLIDYQYGQLTTINQELGASLKNGDLVAFFNDTSDLAIDTNNWDVAGWDYIIETNDITNLNPLTIPSGLSIDPITGQLIIQAEWDTNVFIDAPVNQFIYQVNIVFGTGVLFLPYTDVTTPVVNGDIVFISEGSALENQPLGGSTWYYNNVWQEVTNDKFKANQPPLFQLYDHNNVPLNDQNVYPNNNFGGNKIFSYEENTEPGALVDPVLGFPILYTSLGQASDIIFDNNLMLDRYTYQYGALPISGYYYYKQNGFPGFPTTLGNSWNLYNPTPITSGPCATVEPIYNSRQRVVDRYVVGYNAVGPQTNTTINNILKFQLSVTPYGYEDNCPDLIVAVNGTELTADQYSIVSYNSNLYVDLSTYLANWTLTYANQPNPVVELFTYTWDLLNPSAQGYFEIPQQLEANPNQEEIFRTSGSNLSPQFSSIIGNQAGFKGVSFGGDNNYRDTYKNLSLGTFILQNKASLLKTMLISSSDDLDIINAIRFSENEYVKFKVKYLRTAQQLVNQKFTPASVFHNTVVISDWVDQIFQTINIAKEFSNAFAYSYMVAAGAVFATETSKVPAIDPSNPGQTLTIQLQNQLNINDPENAIFIYDTSRTVAGAEQLLVIGVDYNLIQVTPLSPITVVFYTGPGNVVPGDNITINFYENPAPTYVPSTPSKVGSYMTYVPEIITDNSYAIPVSVIIGHDGSRTVARGDYTDQLLLELEKRIYNAIQSKFRNDYNIPLPLEIVKPGYYRTTRYSRIEYLDITQSYLNKWSSKYNANYRLNEYSTFSPAVSSQNQWMLWNYTKAVNATTLQPLNLPGNWKGIFEYYYDTVYPDTAPWEMLGFTEEPTWWVAQYGANGTWGSNNTQLWNDLQSGIIRQGNRATLDPETGNPLPNPLWARPGLSAVIPVDASQNLRTVPEIFNVAVADNYNPFDGYTDPWVYGDGSPVEQAWYNSSDYPYSTNEFLYLMNPAPFGEFYFDTLGTDYSPANQYVQNDKYLPYDFYVQVDDYYNNQAIGSGDPYFVWMRPKNSDQIVHAESLPDGSITVRFGYQCWVSDYLLFLGKDITQSFGTKVRSLDVNLANKFGGFTNQTTANVYIQSVTPGATTTSLSIPSTNYEVDLHVGQPIAVYSYSGVIIRAEANGTFTIYGYDLLNPQFTVFTRQMVDAQQIIVGGTPAPWIPFQTGSSYSAGTIVRYNGVYYQTFFNQVNVSSFDPTQWVKLKALPIIDGVSVTYYPVPTLTTKTIPYGTNLGSVQEVFDFLIGWGDYLTSQGWDFTLVNPTTSQVSDWLYSAKQFLFWLNTSWAPNATIQLSPIANLASIQVAAGYPDNIEKISNGVYSILDKYGVAIQPSDVIVERTNQIISVTPQNLESGGIYYLQVSASETEHILIFDNTTSFGDIIYDPLYRARQERLTFNGFRSKNWFGKMEAPGYLILGNQLLPNYDTLVDDIRYFYDPNVVIDNPSAEELGRHLIGYQNQSYLSNLEMSDNTQYLFYQGMIRQKGTIQAFNKLFRDNRVVGNTVADFTNEQITVYEEWALKLGSFGNTIDQVSTEFILEPEQNSGQAVIARLNYVPSELGFVQSVNILNAQNVYSTPPKLIIDPPTGVSLDQTRPTRQAQAYAILNPTTGVIARVDVSDPGYGYITNPSVTIVPGINPISGQPVATNLDVLYSVYQGEIQTNAPVDNIIDIDIDETDVWTVRPADPEYTLVFPTTNNIYYNIPNAGYANVNDVDWLTFNIPQTYTNWGATPLNPAEGDTVWLDNDQNGDWDIYKLVSYDTVIPESSWDVYLQNPPYQDEQQYWDKITFPLPATGTISLAGGTLTGINITNSGEGYLIAPTVTITGDGSGATATALISNGAVTEINLTNAGTGYTTATVTLSAPPTSVTATGTTTVASGGVTGATITNGGHYYITPPTVTFTGGAGTGASATAIVANGIVVGLTNIVPGTGYTSAPTITFSAPAVVPVTATGSATLSCAIQAVNVTYGGTQYVTAPLVTISGGAGSGAIAVANVNASGQISSVTITNGGTGYDSSATVTFATAPLANNYVTLYDQGFEIYANNSNQLILSVIDENPINDNDFKYIALQVVADGVNVPTSNYLVSLTLLGPRTELRQITDLVYYGDPNYPPGPDEGPVSITYQVSITWQDYNMFDNNGVPFTPNEISDYLMIDKLLLFKQMRLPAIPTTLPYYVDSGDKIWIDVDPNGKWGVYTINQYRLPILFREQTELINTKLFENAQIYQDSSQEIVLLPVYDPFKGILPNLAAQNITYRSYQDPARYNITSDPRLYSPNIIFGPKQVGQLWWDFTNCRYFYYEQPIALDGSETENDNLIYRRNHWGQLFPGSTIDIYEWVASPVPPSLYTGTGTPRSLTDAVQVTTFNSLTNIFVTTYYFWVLNTTDQPNLQNRTLPAIQVTSLLTSPTTQNYQFFTPIQQTDTNNSYMFYNVQNVLAFQGNNVQIQYRTSERDDPKHTQWGFYREGDSESVIPSTYWNKFVDSICGYTDVLPNTNAPLVIPADVAPWGYYNWDITPWDGVINTTVPVLQEFGPSIDIANYLPWDMFGWDISPWDDATSTSTPLYGQILPVPDPLLSKGEMYGVEFRPRQGMFVNLVQARKILYQSANKLLIQIPIRDINPEWNINVATDNYWQYTNWYADGYNNAIPTAQYQTLADATTALIAGQLSLNQIIKIIEGTNEAIIADKRYALYAVNQVANTNTLYLKLIGYQNSAIQLLPTVYTTTNVYNLSVELRQLLTAINTEIFINSYAVDSNLLFFSMINFVLSEQRNPDWVFKSSYIYIKEQNVPLNQPSSFIPDEIDNIIGYINDVKPYHTQIRDYTESYTTIDVAPGAASDTIQQKIQIQFGPGGGDEFPGAWNTTLTTAPTYEWDTGGWDSGMPIHAALFGNTLDASNFDTTINQFVDDQVAYTIDLSSANYDPSKKGYSSLYPYTFSLMEMGNYFIVPNNIVAAQIGDITLIYGQDYYVEVNTDTTYTIYFYSNPLDPVTNPSQVYPQVFVLFDGGDYIVPIGFNTYRNEIAIGTGRDNLVINVDTQLYFNEIDGIASPINQTWDSDFSLYQVGINTLNGNPTNQPVGWDSMTPWDQSVVNTAVPYPEYISYKENIGSEPPEYFRNNLDFSGTLETAITDNTTTFTVNAGNIFQPPRRGNPGTIWIDGEQIAFGQITETSANVWKFERIERAYNNTSQVDHNIGALVLSTFEQQIVAGNPTIDRWNAINTDENAPVAVGGLWYARTPEALFLIQGQGNVVP